MRYSGCSLARGCCPHATLLHSLGNLLALLLVMKDQAQQGAHMM